MSFCTRICSLLPALALAAASAQAAVVVSFPQPERYSDVGGWGIDPQPSIDEIGRHLQRLGNRYLSPRETLRIEVLDIDLAGQIRPFGHTQTPVRVMKGAVDWPRMTLRYTLESDGKVSETREENLSYSQYLSRTSNNDALYHEKRMLDDWFRKRFGKRER